MQFPLLKAVDMLWILTLLVCAASTVGICPSSESLAPLCWCRDSLMDSYMTCSNVYSTDDLYQPIQSTEGNKYKIYSLQIFNSSLLYIPHNLFLGTKFEKIYFLKSQIMSLSDSDDAFEGLEDTLSELRAAEAHYVAQWDFRQLRNLKKLGLIDVSHIIMGELSEPIPELKHLTALGITHANIKFIVDYAFAKLPKLRILNLKGNNIEELKRNMLPEPANDLEFLDFSFNNLQDLPTNFFTTMPSLHHVSLTNNKFFTISENIFRGVLDRLHSLDLFENPLRCDCRLQWILGSRRAGELIAKCAEPASLAGKSLINLQWKELVC